MGLGLKTRMGNNDCKLEIILKNYIFASSTRFVWLSIITSWDLCRIVLKLFYSDFGFPSLSAANLEFFLKVTGSIFHENCEFTFVKWINEMETVVVFKKSMVEESQMRI